MRVGISGVSSTGKSTLAKRVAEAVGYPAMLDVDLHEKSFHLLDLWNQTPHTNFFPDMYPNEKVAFERAVFNVRQDLESATDDWIADESPIDFLNYLYIMASPYPLLMNDEEFEYYVDAWKSSVARYDIIWYLPYGVLPIEDDKRRFTNPNLLRFWDYSMSGIIGELDIPCLRVMPPHTDINRRVAEVVTSIVEVQKSL